MFFFFFFPLKKLINQGQSAKLTPDLFVVGELGGWESLLFCGGGGWVHQWVNSYDQSFSLVFVFLPLFWPDERNKFIEIEIMLNRFVKILPKVNLSFSFFLK